MFSFYRELTRPQRHAFLAAFGGWSLDAFDFFVFVFCLRAISSEFHTDVKSVAEGVFLTLAFRPVGALVFGWLAEKYGRRPVLMINIVSYSAVEFASAFAPNLSSLLLLRALFGFAMGGEWGVGAALALETLPAKGRGFYSGLLQVGYVVGYLLASIVFACAFTHIGWRGMFMIGAVPALLALYVRVRVAESPAWLSRSARRPASARELGHAIKRHGPELMFLVVLMTCFNAFSHGSQDLYPTFLQAQYGFSPETTGKIAIVMNLGALTGGIFFGTLSERIGRKRAILLAAALSLPMIPMWAFSHTAVMLACGGFLMQFMVQGAWGVVPAHLNELSPPSVRAILPGFAYQLGNLAMSRMGPFQARVAEAHGGNYAYILSSTMVVTAVALVVVTALGREARAVRLDVSS
jgi:SHS family lactate transporter-like MFS transporter